MCTYSLCILLVLFDLTCWCLLKLIVTPLMYIFWLCLIFMGIVLFLSKLLINMLFSLIPHDLCLKELYAFLYSCDDFGNLLIMEYNFIHYCMCCHWMTVYIVIEWQYMGLWIQLCSLFNKMINVTSWVMTGMLSSTLVGAYFNPHTWYSWNLYLHMKWTS